MVKAGWGNTFYKIGNWVYRLAFLNLLWILFMITGIFILGFFPSTVAMFALGRKLLNNKGDIPIFGEFLKIYRREFLKSNLLGYILLLLGTLLYFDLEFFRGSEGTVYLILSYIFICLFLIFLMTVLLVFPVYVHFELGIIGYLKQAFLITLASPIRSIMLAAITFFIYYVMMQVPATILFFGISIEVMAIMWFSLQTFRKLEKKKISI